jgi:hypothetical protein
MASVHSRVTGGTSGEFGDIVFTVALPDSHAGEVITVSLTATQVSEDGQLTAMAGGSKTFEQQADGDSVKVVANVHYLTGAFDTARPIVVQTQASYVWGSYLVPTPDSPDHEDWTVQHVGEGPPTNGITS